MPSVAFPSCTAILDSSTIQDELRVARRDPSFRAYLGIEDRY